ncbi:pyridoxamine 5'-phosphate oxidase family protein [Cellulosimicrobium terreum]|nr:pyridoxamine 5'-phosphate oxidase family protein [Cellulosimicrobium terreum]
MTGYTPENVELLGPAECRELVDGTHVARLALSVGGEPDIYPLTVRTQEGRAVFRTVPGTKLATLVTNARVALEWDGVRPDHAWSVVARGTAARLETAAEVAAVEASPEPLEPVVDVPTEDWVAVTLGEVTGRRFRRPDR